MQTLKNISELMLVIVFLSVFCGLASAAPWLGSGTANDPYQIWDACDVNTLGTETGYYASHFKMMADVNMAAYLYTTAVIAPDTISGGLFDGTVFTGVFDGNDHVIRNLTINTSGANNYYLGLFGKVDTSAARIENLGVIDASITAGDYSYYVGVLAGWFEDGTISNCHTSGSVTGYYNVGGLAGLRSEGTITNCYTSGSLTVGSTGLRCGGLFGYSYGNIADCYSSCSVSGNDDVGGLVGYSYTGTISYCYAVGSVTGLGGSPSAIGGLVGNRNSGSVVDSYWDTDTSGQASSDGGTGKTTTEMMQQATFANWDFVDTWTIGEKQSYPLFRRYTAADLNCDGQVNFNDLAIFADRWLTGVE
jgi:hypothetical protein